MILAPSGTALFVANSTRQFRQQSTPARYPAEDISAYTVKSDGTLTAASGNATAGITL